MSVLHFKQLKESVKRSLATAAYPPKKLAFLSSGISVAATLIFSLLGLYFSRQMDVTGGLAGMGQRALLSTIQWVLSVGVPFAGIFWSFGFVFACLQFARSEDVTFSSLAEGFRRFGPLLRLILLEMLIYMAVLFVAAQVSTVIFMMTPLSLPLAGAMSALPQTDLAAADMMALTDAAMPLYAIATILFIVLLIPVFYRFRLAHFYLLDDNHRRALAALGISNRLMTGNRFALFKVDLHLWWYYVASAVLIFVGNIDMIFGLTGWASIAVYALYLLGHLLLTWLANAYVQTIYAHAYLALKNTDDVQRPYVRNFPWGFLPDHE